MKAAMDGEMKHFYEFGPFRVDPTKRLLMRNGEPQPLTPKFEGAATQREVLNIQPSASGQEQSDRNKARARDMQEDEAFTSACEQGRAMTLEQAIAFALM